MWLCIQCVVCICCEIKKGQETPFYLNSQNSCVERLQIDSLSVDVEVNDTIPQCLQHQYDVYCVHVFTHKRHMYKRTVCVHTPRCLNTYKELILSIDGLRHTHTYKHINLGKIRNRRSTVGWQRVLTTSTLNGPCVLLIYKTSLSVYFWQFYSDVIYTGAGFWEEPNPGYAVAFHVHTPLWDIWVCPQTWTNVTDRDPLAIKRYTIMKIICSLAVQKCIHTVIQYSFLLLASKTSTKLK